MAFILQQHRVLVWLFLCRLIACKGSKALQAGHVSRVYTALASSAEQFICCRQLGELLHGEDFSLFEAMSAVEIGDPKLDAGLTVDYSQPTDRCAPLAEQCMGRALL